VAWNHLLSYLRRVIQMHMDATESDIARMEGQGALNFLDIDDVPIDEEGELIDRDSVLQLESKRKLGDLIQRFQLPSGNSEDIVEEDVILLWNEHPRVVTGADILGRLLRGIARPALSPPVRAGASSTSTGQNSPAEALQ